MAANVTIRESKHVDRLLPGIPDDIVLYYIVPKLGWKDFHILACVSRACYDAIRSRRVFDSRVLRQSFDTLVGYNDSSSTIALYSMMDNSWHRLPPIADTSGERNDVIPRLRFPTTLGQCITMDGKIYVLGGMMYSEVSNQVIVFDVAAGGKWKQCASMNQCRRNFGISVMDGKIYVFGGMTEVLAHHSVLDPTSRLLSDSEVYEPKEDTWSPIRCMSTCRYGQHVTQIGEELFTHGGWTRDGDGVLSRERSLEAYHPVKDEWRILGNSLGLWPEPVVFFTEQGSLFSIRGPWLDSLDIHKYDVRGNSWIHMHSFSSSALPIPVECFSTLWVLLGPDALLVVDGELIAFVRCSKRNEHTQRPTQGLCLFQSRGFSSDNRKISWKLRATTFEEERLILSAGAEYFVQKL